MSTPPRFDVEMKAERVLRCAESVLPGEAVSYGDVARLCGTGPRQVGRIMAVYGSSVPWWRVTNAKGELPPHLRERASAHWEAEGFASNSAGTGIDLRRHRAHLGHLESRWRVAIADL